VTQSIAKEHKGEYEEKENVKRFGRYIITTWMVRIASLTILVASSLQLYGQYVEIRAELDTNQITIGDQFYLKLKVDQPVSAVVEFPAFSDTIIGNIEILGQSGIDTTHLSNDRLELKQHILLTSFDSGFYEIPPFPFKISLDNWTDSIYSNPSYLFVHTVALDSVIRDIKQPLHVPVSFAEIYPYVLIGLFTAAMIIALFYYLRKRKRKEPLFRTLKPSEPAHVIALRELDKLSSEKLWQKGEHKNYYTRLTEIIRVYIEMRYDIPAMEQTSMEILEAWDASGYGENTELIDILKKLLSLADLVKFAKEKPLPEDNEVNLENAYEFVRLTKPASILREDTEQNVDQDDKMIDVTEEKLEVDG